MVEIFNQNSMRNMSAQEIREYVGGSIVEVILGAVVATIISDWDDFKENFVEGFNKNIK